MAVKRAKIIYKGKVLTKGKGIRRRISREKRRKHPDPKSFHQYNFLLAE